MAKHPWVYYFRRFLVLDTGCRQKVLLLSWHASFSVPTNGETSVGIPVFGYFLYSIPVQTHCLTPVCGSPCLFCPIPFLGGTLNVVELYCRSGNLRYHEWVRCASSIPRVRARSAVATALCAARMPERPQARHSSSSGTVNFCGPAWPRTKLKTIDFSEPDIAWSYE